MGCSLMLGQASAPACPSGCMANNAGAQVVASYTGDGASSAICLLPESARVPTPRPTIFVAEVPTTPPPTLNSKINGTAYSVQVLLEENHAIAVGGRALDIEICRACCIAFDGVGGCQAMRNGLEYFDHIPTGCASNTVRCEDEMVTYCGMSPIPAWAARMCTKCLDEFDRNDGCTHLLRGQNYKNDFRVGCEPCAPHAKSFCQHVWAAITVDGSLAPAPAAQVETPVPCTPSDEQNSTDPACNLTNRAAASSRAQRRIEAPQGIVGWLSLVSLVVRLRWG
jgi:hypothetical protein